jgi:hypothetical protein
MRDLVYPVPETPTGNLRGPVAAERELRDSTGRISMSTASPASVPVVTYPYCPYTDAVL